MPSVIWIAITFFDKKAVFQWAALREKGTLNFLLNHHFHAYAQPSRKETWLVSLAEISACLTEELLMITYNILFHREIIIHLLYLCKLFSYTFSLESYTFYVPSCNASDPNADAKTLLQGSRSAAEFYVFVGVIVFLYCLAALVMYVFCDDFYRKHNACTVGVSIVLQSLHTTIAEVQSKSQDK